MSKETPMFSMNSEEETFDGFSGERRLWAAVLYRAIKDFTDGKDKVWGSKFSGTDADLSPRSFKDAALWLFRSGEDKSPGSLSWVCHHLGYEVEDVRKKVLEMEPGEVPYHRCRTTSVKESELIELLKSGYLLVADGYEDLWQ